MESSDDPISVKALLKKKADLAAAQSWCHTRTASLIYVIDTIISIAVMILGAMILIIPLLTLEGDLDGIGAKVAEGVLGAIVTLLEGVRRYFKFVTRIGNHRASAGLYNTVFYDVLKELSVKNTPEEELQPFILSVIDTYNEIYTSSPGIWHFVIKMYLHKYSSVTKINKYEMLGVQTISMVSSQKRKKQNGVLPTLGFGQAVPPHKRIYQMDRYFLDDSVISLPVGKGLSDTESSELEDGGSI